ncbi:unnamed protein product, partial [Mycena citricolor]
HILKDLNDIVAKTVTEVHGAIVITISLGHELEAVPPRTSRRPNMCSRICLLKGASSIKSMPLFISTPGPELLDRTLRLLCGLILALLLFLNMPRDMSYRKPVPAYIPSPPPSPAAGFRERMSFGDASGYPEDVPGSVADSFSNHPNSSLSSVHTLPRHRNELVSGALQVPRIAPPVYVRTSFFRVQTYRPPTPPKGREPTHLPKYQVSILEAPAHSNSKRISPASTVRHVVAKPVLFTLFLNLDIVHLRRLETRHRREIWESLMVAEAQRLGSLD